MGTKLLVRAYNVGCGDCIYIRIPNGKDGHHILIDCGKKGDDVLLKQAIDHLKKELPLSKDKKKRRLDLIVATHRHEDHIKGFDADWFDDIQVGAIWMSAVMNPKHPQAKKVNHLHAVARQSVRQLVSEGRALGPELDLLVSLYGVSNDAADDLLMKKLPKANGIDPEYVHAGMPPKKLGKATIHILGPEEDIDHFYLGEDIDKTLNSMRGFNAAAGGAMGGGLPVVTPAAAPKNISTADFRTLQSRMLSNGLAFAQKDSEIQNNMSVVLLIEWEGRRLMFVGDAEWAGEFRAGKQNGSWNVMWEKRRKLLDKPVDFLKIGHHGSINSTPPPPGMGPKKAPAPDAASVTQILDAILPLPKGGKKPTAQAVVSTEREFYNPIPEGKLLAELGKRVTNTRNYREALKRANIDEENEIWITAKAKKNKFYSKYEKNFLGEPQPLRTDLEHLLNPKLGFVEVEIPPQGLRR